MFIRKDLNNLPTSDGIKHINEMIELGKFKIKKNLNIVFEIM